MVYEVKQREDIAKFCEFVTHFLITESATVAEAELVLGNAKILVERIESTILKTKIGGQARYRKQPYL